MSHTPTPWIVDDRHIHPNDGLTYPCGQEPETDVIVLVDTDCHKNGLLNETDVSNLKFIVRACNAHEELLEALRECVTESGAYAYASEDFYKAKQRLMAITNIAKAAIAKATS